MLPLPLRLRPARDCSRRARFVNDHLYLSLITALAQVSIGSSNLVSVVSRLLLPRARAGFSTAKTPTAGHNPSTKTRYSKTFN
jgi:hypothetical protein